MTPRESATLSGLAAAALVASCTLNRGGRMTQGADVTTVASVGGGGSLAEGGAAGAPLGGSGGSGGSGGGPTVGGAGGIGGAVVDALDEPAPVVRYFLDEASSGAAPSVALDAAPSPADLTLDYGAANLAYQAVAASQTGLAWDIAGAGGIAWRSPLASTKIEADLEGATRATLEVVLRVDAGSTDSQIAGISANTCGTYCDNLVLMTNGDGDLRLFVNDALVGAWAPSFGTLGRVVLHVVVDSTAGTASSRVALYVDGTPTPQSGGALTLPMNSGIAIPDDDGYFLIGNRDPQTKSFAGWIGYVAVYDQALSPSSIAGHAARLLASDDTMP